MGRDWPPPPPYVLRIASHAYILWGMRPTFILLANVVARLAMLGCGGNHKGSESDASKDDSHNARRTRDQ